MVVEFSSITCGPIKNEKDQVNAAGLMSQFVQQLDIIGARQRQCIENVMQSNQNLNERLQSALEVVHSGTLL